MTYKDTTDCPLCGDENAWWDPYDNEWKCPEGHTFGRDDTYSLAHLFEEDEEYEDD